jgi:hypothetical protein
MDALFEFLSQTAAGNVKGIEPAQHPHTAW